MRNAETAALADRVVNDPLMLAENAPVRRDECAGNALFPRQPPDGGGIVAVRGKADILAVPFARVAEALRLGDGARLALAHGPQREERVRKLPLRHGIEHIALVLRLVERLLENVSLPRTGDARIVAGDDLFAAELLGAAEERVELHAPVALDAGVRRAGAPIP